jgi:hypothetical protein
MEIGWNTQLSTMDKAAYREWHPIVRDPLSFCVALVASSIGKKCQSSRCWRRRPPIQTGRLGAQTRDLAPSVLIEEVRPMVIAKAKILGVLAELGYTWKVMRVLLDGAEVRSVLARDSCRQRRPC